MIRPMVILPPVIFMSLAVLFYLGLARSDPDALPSTFIGQLAPQVLVTPLGADAPFAAADLQKSGGKDCEFLGVLVPTMPRRTSAIDCAAGDGFACLWRKLQG